MARRVLLGSTAEEEMLDVKLLLQEEFEVRLVASFDALLKEARTSPPDLIVVTEALEGGSGTELCALLDGDPRRPTILFVGDARVRGADACVADGNTVMIADMAQDLLQRRALDVKAEPTEPSIDGDTLGWAVAPNPLGDIPPKPSKSKPAAPPPTPASAPAGNDLLRALAAENAEGLLRRVRESDYFEILGVTPAATPAEIRAAHAARLGVLRDLARDSSAGRAHAEEVRSALDEALDVLVDPGLRAAYTRHRPA